MSAQLTNQKYKAIELLKKVFGKKNGTIKSIRPIHTGYTNQSFVVEYENGKKYQVRLPHCGDLINRSSEYQILTLVGQKKLFSYFDIKTGTAVKEWIKGSTPYIPSLRKWKYTDDLFSKIKKLHSLPLPSKHSFTIFNLNAYNENLFRLKLKYQTKFLEIVDLYRDDSMVLNHTDINSQNLIISKSGRITMIDFEWCGLASDYWDYANFIREEGIRYTHIEWDKYIRDFDMGKLKNYIYASAVLAYLWTWAMPQTKKIIRYRRKTLRQVYHYAHGVVDNEIKK